MARRSEDVEIEHPNREKAASKATRAIVTLLLIASAVLVGVITVGGWSATAGAQPVSIVYVVIYLVMAHYVLRWNRGLLPVAAGLAIVMLIFAAVSVPAWFDRDHAGYTDPALSAGVLGLLTAIVVPVQALLIIFALRGFTQGWNVEVERLSDGSTRSVA